MCAVVVGGEVKVVTNITPSRLSLLLLMGMRERRDDIWWTVECVLYCIIPSPTQWVHKGIWDMIVTGLIVNQLNNYFSITI